MRTLVTKSQLFSIEIALCGWHAICSFLFKRKISISHWSRIITIYYPASILLSARDLLIRELEKEIYMAEITIPLPDFEENQIAEVVLTVNGKKKKYNFRIESFHWGNAQDETGGSIEKTTLRIGRLHTYIENYDCDWEIIQIYPPADNSEYIQVLFRKRIK
jgi:hypothetical protein